MRPANDAQALAYRLLHEGEDRLPPDVQQSFIDQRGGIPGEVEEEQEVVPATPIGSPAPSLEQPMTAPEQPEEKESSDEETQV
eukprot:3757933-Karenia_brevis.AAC.1